MIQVKGLCRSHRSGAEELVVLQNLDLEVNRSDSIAIIGRSGSGKTTLLSILGGLESDFSGSVCVDGLALEGLDDRALSRYRAEKVGLVFQGAHHVAHLSCLENVSLPALFAPPGSSSLTRWASVRRRALQLLELVGLNGLEGRRPSELSGGQKQRLGIARALLNRPAILLCDEVTGNLDPTTADEILGLLSRLNESQGVTIVMATHDPEAAATARAVMRMDNGRLYDAVSLLAGSGR